MLWLLLETRLSAEIKAHNAHCFNSLHSMQGFGVISQHEPQRMKVKNYSVNVEEKIQPSIYISRPKP